MTDWFTEALERFRAAFGDVPAARATAAAAGRIARLGWDKSGLPVLNRAPEPLQALFAASGIDCAPSGAPTFTCDAMWFQEQPGHTCILGPGALGENGAHTDQERLAECELARFAETVSDLCRAFDRAGATR
jgi:hypothetical protein